ncbi:activity-regulated cytoskeleton-associated protein-like [Belonocnema kinseyi]|uniref:activity-regulated cytoskeleton-associated protein-like n=1 Tax=Belonocnema kinseyi TaxID=2817044 RepID=UPI00143D7747|nr:activity-regulated cytoskeleton-associated protein-like [Belonocnema kinseyi]
MDDEDPEEFLNQCEYYFTEAAIQQNVWSRMVNKSLNEKAAKWYEAYRNLSLPWSKFRMLLTQDFAGAAALNKLHTKLYATKQEEKEAVHVFLQRKYLVAQRLLPQATGSQIVTLLLEALKPSIKKVLRAAVIGSFEDLVERAVQAESGEAEENP